MQDQISIAPGVTLMIVKMLTNYQNNSTYAQVIKQEFAKGDRAKAIFIDQINRNESAIRQLTAYMQPETMRIVKEEILNDEASLQLQAIIDMFLCMPKGKRDEIEAYVSGQYNIYKLN